MCMDEQMMNTYLDGELVEPFLSMAEEHMCNCSICRNKVDEFRRLRENMKAAELTDEEIAPRQERVLAYIEKNHFGKKKKIRNVLRRRMEFKVYELACIAAAFVVVFIGSWAILSSGSENGENSLIRNIPFVNLSNVTPVRSTDNATTSKTLESYTIDEILKNLDSRGYDVDLKLKQVMPVVFEDKEEEQETLVFVPEETPVVQEETEPAANTASPENASVYQVVPGLGVTIPAGHGFFIPRQYLFSPEGIGESTV